MFKTAKKEITIPIVVYLLRDGGRQEQVKFSATYRIPPTHHDKQQLLESINSDAVTDDALLQDYLLGWSNLRGEDGQIIEFTPESLEAALDLTEYRQALAEGFMRATFNLKGERAKN